MVTVTRDVTLSASQNLAEFFNYKPHGGHRAFWNFVGVDWMKLKNQSNDGKDHWVLTDEAAERVRLLAGPHFRIYIKILQARGAKIDLTLCSHW